MKKMFAIYISLLFAINAVMCAEDFADKKQSPKKEIVKKETKKEKINQKFNYKSCKANEKNKGCNISDLIKINKLP